MSSEEKKPRFNSYTKVSLIQKIDRFLAKGADIFEIVSKVGATPSTSSILHAGVKLTQHAMDASLFTNYKVVSWPTHALGSHYKFIFQVLATFPHRIVATNKENPIIFYDFYGCTIAKCNPEGAYFHYREDETTPEKLDANIARAIWEKIGSPCKLFSAGNNTGSDIIEYELIPAAELYESKLCSKLINRIKSFYANGVSRSMMLIGPPGTGKTSIINKVAASFGSRVLSVDINSLTLTQGTILSKYILRLDPDVLVINDFDRARNISGLLTALEELNNLKLFMVSVNSTSDLPKAVLRPGRFDETITIKYLDPAVAERIIGIPRNRIPDAVWNSIVQWPAAFISELAKRIKNLGEEKLVEEFSDLKKRVDNNTDEGIEKLEDDEEDTPTASYEEAELLSSEHPILDAEETKWLREDTESGEYE